MSQQFISVMFAYLLLISPIMAASHLGCLISRSTSLSSDFSLRLNLPLYSTGYSLFIGRSITRLVFPIHIFAGCTKLSLLLINSAIRPNNHFWRGCLSLNMLTISPTYGVILLDL